MVARKLYSPNATQRHDNEDNKDNDLRQLALFRPGQSKNEQLGNRLHLVRCHIIRCRYCHIAPHRSCESHIGWDRRCGIHIAGPNPLKGFHRCDCSSEKVSQKSPKFPLKRCVTLRLRFSLKKIAFWDWNHGQMHFFLGSRGSPFFETEVFSLCLPIVDQYEFVYTNLY